MPDLRLNIQAQAGEGSKSKKRRSAHQTLAGNMVAGPSIFSNGSSQHDFALASSNIDILLHHIFVMFLLYF